MKKNRKVKTILLSMILCSGLMVCTGYSQENNFASTDQPSATKEEAKTGTQKDAIKEVEEKKKETEAKLQVQTEQKLAAQKVVEEVKAEKESLEKEVQLKQEEALVTKKELEILKEEVALVKGSETLKMAKELEEKLKILEAEALTQKKKLDLAIEKEALAEKRLQKEQEETAQIKEQVQSLMVQRSGLRTFTEKMIRSVVIILVGLMLVVLLKMAVRAMERMITKEDTIRQSEIELRLNTMGKLFNWLGGILISLTVIYQLLSLYGFNVGPLLAGAGVVGLAFGFGGQYLIRDLINGLFILLEGQYRINDVVKIGEMGGLVEDINLRITTLRDLAGRVIIIPNGEIKIVINFTRGYAQALMDIGVAYKENVDQVMEVIKEVGKGMREDPYFKRLILDDLEMLGVDDFAASAVMIKFRIKTRPIKQWEVSREFRRRLKNKFDELGIEIPFPHTTLYWGTDKDNQWLKEAMEKIAE